MSQKTQRYIKVFIVCLYAGLVLVGVFHHEPWRDEALVWNQARNNSLWQILDNVKYSGTPALSFLVLVPFAKAGLPYIASGIVHAALATVAVALLLFFSKFSLITKILFTFSYFMAYEYAVIARNYVETIVILFALATLYVSRFRRPLVVSLLIALLFHVNSYSLGPAAALAILFSIELLYKRKFSSKSTFAIATMIVGCLSSIALLLPAHYPIQEMELDHLQQVGLMLRDAVIPFFEFSPLSGNVSQFLSTTSIASMIIFLLTFLVLNIRHIKIIFLFVAIFVWHVFMNAYIHLGYLRHHGLLLIFIIFLWWVRGGKLETKWEKISNGIGAVIFNMLLLVSVVFSGYMYYWDYIYPFSGTTDMAAFIQSHVNQTDPIVAFKAPLTEGITAYLPHHYFWYPEYKSSTYRVFSDSRHGRRSEDLISPDVFERMNNHFPNNQKVFLLLTYPLVLVEERQYKLLHVSTAKKLWGSGESFWFYQRP